MMKTQARAIALPVNSCLSHEWKEFTTALHACWQESTALANWAARELSRIDPVRLPSMKTWKDVPKPKLYLYGLAAKVFKLKTGFWSGCCVSASSLLRDVERRHQQSRYKVIWLRAQKFPEYEYPYPFPIHNAAWSAEWDNGPVIACNLPTLGKVKLRLRAGQEFGRQLAEFKRIVSGDCKRSQLIFTRQRSYSSHRGTTTERENGERSHHRIMVRMVTLRDVEQRNNDRVLTLTTDPNAFWIAELDGRQAWVLNADHMKRAFDWLGKHQTKLQRMSQDRKAERRLGINREQLNANLERACLKHQRRINSWLHQTAAHLAGFAVRQKVGHVLYLDVEQGFIEKFPWHRLKTLLSEKLAAAGIVLDCASDKVEVA